MIIFKAHLTFFLACFIVIAPLNSWATFKLEICNVFLHSWSSINIHLYNQNCILDFRDHLEMKNYGCNILGLKLQHFSLCYWSFNGAQHGSWWNRWPNNKAKVICVCGTKKTRNTRKCCSLIIMSPINETLPHFAQFLWHGHQLFWVMPKFHLIAKFSY